MAPHDGRIRIEGTLATSANTSDFVSHVMKNDKSLWSAGLILPKKEFSHNLTVPVSNGDVISFLVHTSNTQPAARNERAYLEHEAIFPDAQHKCINVGVQEISCEMTCHAVSKVVVPLPAPSKTLSAIIGQDAAINDRSTSKKSTLFSVLTGDKVIFTSQALKGSSVGVPVQVDLEGAREFILQVSDGSDGIGYDWANWCEAKTTLSDARQFWLADLPLITGSKNEPRVQWDPIITYVSSATESK